MAVENRDGDPFSTSSRILLRASIGTLTELGLLNVKLQSRPTTAYFMLNPEKGCMASCRFCPQGVCSKTPKNRLSRILWPKIDLETAAEKLKASQVNRICIQTVIAPGLTRSLTNMIEVFKEAGKPVSVSTTPIPDDELALLAALGVDRIGIGLDAASPRVFKTVGKPMSWKAYMDFIDKAVETIGKATVHLIVGLGETFNELLNTLERLNEKKVEIAMFAFTPVPGTPMANTVRPPIGLYRLAQLARYLIRKNMDPAEYIELRHGSPRLKRSRLDDVPPEAFLTAGCPGCNRPFYNESPSLIYNYPSRKLLDKEWGKVRRQLEAVSI